ncbi:sigma-70 family RNA polymerase sigma factor (plasmid) [Nocardia sp. NBC_01503]|uniref:RNA polymerase sigma factor n=1 Tax=Nocardia sp. NBC_01503 TaxID=2975997 RepID=UPI002E7C4A82|nr:sigma-70 family RNA polymerase sigma factor [Nocardia sp. NBC_01503]WTL36688.1 sigma-70 family RNA polymerase sigma factor [Nocardia sp. NBC_01503]WTL36759.1 sigma-70 family RNA polymerase sigma factor [Nocardia sp. NBC_01503]
MTIRVTSEERFGFEGEFEQLFRRHSAAVHRYACKALRGQTHQAEEIVQEVFIAVWKQYARDFSGKPDQQALQLIMKIAARRVIDIHRQRATQPTQPSADLDDSILAVGTDPSRGNPAERVLSQDAVKRFWFGLTRELTDAEYQVALMAWELELAVKEVADILAISVSTVWSHKSRARIKIEKIMQHNRNRIE